MFTDNKKTKEMLIGAYKKIKSYYHYNKNYIFMKEKIASFENDSKQMDSTFNVLASILKGARKTKNIDQWIDQIDYYVLPKAFTGDKKGNGIILIGQSDPDEKVNKVNFFINMPFELYLLDTLWCILIGKIAFDNKCINENCYGNLINNFAIYKQGDSLTESINFHKNQLFHIYYFKYCEWNNNAIRHVEKNYNNKNLALVSLDVKRYFYSVQFDFERLGEYLNNDDRLKEIQILTDIIKKIYRKYNDIISGVCDDVDNNSKEVILPIGLFSSMLVANLYLSEFDRMVSSNAEVLYYGRYVDDIMILLDTKKKILKGGSKEIDYLLVNKRNILTKKKKEYSIYNYPNLIIQREKVKVLFLEKGKSDSIVRALKQIKEKQKPSQMDVMPQTDFNLEDFEEVIYGIDYFDKNVKIREIIQPQVNRYKLGIYMTDIVKACNINSNRNMEDYIRLKEEGRKIIKFFNGSNALKYYTNWINAFYFFVLFKDGKENWSTLKKNIRTSIKGISLGQLENIPKEKTRTIRRKIIEDLNKALDICISSALAVNPSFSKKEKKEILLISLMLRHANLFNHNLVNIPLANYFESLDDSIDLSNVTFDMIQGNTKISFSPKWKYSPRFIRLEELFHYTFIKNMYENSNDGNEVDYPRMINGSILKFFFKVNEIYRNDIRFAIKNEEQKNGYIIQRISFGEKRCKKIKIALANI